ncbi:hypothetical protein [Enhygromyxa salina]|uniref:hypothetical protein n=1 Tax=Enhygromyxa salina TaxID=215803 RepID=UPI000D034FAF|nr:hypothetical protein [Enhygromyxa salina]
MALSVLGAGVVFVGANVCTTEVPPPLWTQADLDNDVPEADNGWSLVVAENHVKVPESLAKLVDGSERDAERYWADVDQQADALQAFLATDAAREVSDQLDQARARPGFADTCQLGGGGACLTIAWRDVHRVGVLRAAALARAGESADASLLLRDLIRMDTAHLQSARYIVSFLVASANMRAALTQANMLASRLDQREVTADTRVAMAELAQVVEAVDIEAINLQRVVIGEYLACAQTLERLESGDAELPDRAKAPPGIGWAFDRGETLRSLNERFEHRYRAAGSNDAAATFGAGEDSPKQEFAWWLRNPVGKLYIDSTIVDLEWGIEADLEQLGRARVRALGNVLAHVDG